VAWDDQRSSEVGVEIAQTSWRQPGERLPSVWAALLIYDLFPAILDLVVFTIWLYWRALGHLA